jgi:Flp pilus assembly protein TadB
MARRVSLFAREVTVKLAPVAVDLLHSAARMLTEGEMTGNLYSGSTMMTVDLARAIDRISDSPDATTALRVAFLYAADERCRDHARRIGVAEARKKAGCDLSLPHVDVESRAKGPELHFSINVEAQRRNA